jgi:hypothetical protein
MCNGSRHGFLFCIRKRHVTGTEINGAPLQLQSAGVVANRLIADARGFVTIEPLRIKRVGKGRTDTRYHFRAGRSARREAKQT